MYGLERAYSIEAEDDMIWVRDGGCSVIALSARCYGETCHEESIAFAMHQDLYDNDGMKQRPLWNDNTYPTLNI